MDLIGDIFTFGEWKLDSEAASPLRLVVLETNGPGELWAVNVGHREIQGKISSTLW